MSPRFHRRRSVAGSVRRIAALEIGRALDAIRDDGLDEAEVIHVVRQQLKRLRGLIRLVRPHFPDYGAENVFFRDLGRRLAPSRDADVLDETFGTLTARAGLHLPEARARLAGEGSPPESRLPLLRGEIASALEAARARAQRWRLTGEGFSLIAPGLRRVYRKVRRAGELASAHPTPLHFHEWRKQTKYHASHLALIGHIAPKIFRSYRRIADQLADTLGEHHDLDALTSAVLRHDLPKDARLKLLRAIQRRNARLEARAFRLGDELTTERPKDFLRRVEKGWKSWRG